jgi:hypothetical protein
MPEYQRKTPKWTRNNLNFADKNITFIDLVATIQSETGKNIDDLSE